MTGPSASAGTNVSAPTVITVPISTTMNSGVCVGSVPPDGGTLFAAASAPASASTGMASQYRANSITMPSAVL